MRRWLEVLFVVTLLVGCATVPEARPVPPVIASPADGQALVYFFRPTLDRVGRSDHPALVVDEQVIGELGYATYTAVSLPPGPHRLQVRPGSRDAKSWATDGTFDVVAGQTAFVAIWNPDQPGSAKAPGEIQAMAMSHGALGGLVLGTLLEIRNAAGIEAGARLEPVENDIGREALAGLTFVVPQRFPP